MAALLIGSYVGSRSPIPLHPPASNRVNTSTTSQSEQPRNKQPNYKTPVIQPAPASITGQTTEQRGLSGRQSDSPGTESDQSKIPDWVQGISAALSAIASILSAIASIFLWRLTRRQIGISAIQANLMRTQSYTMQQQLVAAEVSANAAENSAITARKSLEGLERPYVVAIDITLVQPSYRNVGQQLQGYLSRELPDPRRIWFETLLTLTVKNYGRTPAIIRRIECSLVYKSLNFTLRPEQAGHDLSLSEDIIIIAAGDKATFSEQHLAMVAVEGPNERLEAIGNVCLAGAIRYEDWHGRGWERRFLYRLKAAGGHRGVTGGSERNYEREINNERAGTSKSS